MKYNTLGTTNIKISRICLGTMTWGQQNTEKDAQEQLDYALEQGINFIDTAELYAVPTAKETSGLTETFIGNYFKNNPSVRKNIILATKIAGPGVKYIRNGEGFTPDGIDRAVQDSLRRLNTDYIDLYQLHWPQRRAPIFGTNSFKEDWLDDNDRLQEVLSKLGTLVKKGLIREIGLSNENSWGTMHCLRLHERDSQIPRIQSVQNAYSLVCRRADSELIEVFAREQVSLLPYSPLAGGLLTGKYLNGQRPEGARFSTWGASSMPRYINNGTESAVNAYVELAKNHKLSPTHLALAFVNDRSVVASNIIGATTMDQLKECIASDKVSLSSEILDKIEAIHNDNPSPVV